MTRALAPRPAIDRDVVNRALQDVTRYAQVLRPEEVDEPILTTAVAHAVHEWLVEINYATELAAVHVTPRRLALLYGPPGTGKTTLAHHVAARLGLPLVAVQSERIVESYVGQTSANLGKLFDILTPIEPHCVLLLDEQLMEGMKRTLVLAPRLHQDVSRPEVVFEHVIASIAPPPEMTCPPLWAERGRSLAQIADAGAVWPPRQEGARP